MFTHERYRWRKEKGQVVILPESKVKFKDFDPLTGEVNQVTTEEVQLSELQAKRAMIVEELADLDALIADLTAP